MAKPVWSHVLALSVRTLKKAHIVSSQGPEPESRLQISACKANSSPISLPNHT